MIPRIAIEKESTGRESTALQRFALDHKIPCRFVQSAKQTPPGWMAAGSVEFVEEALGKRFPPDHFPEFCKNHIGRKWWVETHQLPEDRPVFVKPADRLKRFTGFLSAPGGEHPPGPWIVQEPIHFLREFRYYILNGKVLAAEWYPTEPTPDAEPIPNSPNLPVTIPSDWSGTLDFGETLDGRFLLVEAHPAFACGWYGDNNQYSVYAQWLIGGWNNLHKKTEHEIQNTDATLPTGTDRPLLGE